MPNNSSTINEISLEKLLKDIESLEGVVASWDEHERNIVLALRRAIDDLNREAIARLIRTLKADPAALPALKSAVADEVVYTVLRHHEIIKPSLNERVEQALETVRPMLQGHGGNVELVAIEPPATAVIRLLGACSGCPASELTLSEGVEKAIKEHCPEITEIVKAKGVCKSGGDIAVNFFSPFASKQDKTWSFAATIDQIVEDKILVCEVDGQSLLLARFDDQVVCYQNACAHLGMPLDAGELKDGILKCPYHSFQYLLKTGECLTVPEVQLHTHPVRIINNRVEVSLT